MNFPLNGGRIFLTCAVNFTPSRWSMALQKFLDPEGAARNKRGFVGYEAMNHLADYVYV